MPVRLALGGVGRLGHVSRNPKLATGSALITGMDGSDCASGRAPRRGDAPAGRRHPLRTIPNRSTRCPAFPPPGWLAKPAQRCPDTPVARSPLRKPGRGRVRRGAPGPIVARPRAGEHVHAVLHGGCRIIARRELVPRRHDNRDRGGGRRNETLAIASHELGESAKHAVLRLVAAIDVLQTDGGLVIRSHVRIDLVAPLHDAELAAGGEGIPHLAR